MADNPKNDSGARSASPLANLPKKEGGASPSLSNLPQKPATPGAPKATTPALPSLKEQKTKSTPAPKESIEGKKSRIGPVFWTVASVISLTVNVVVLVILLSVLSILRTAKLNVLTLGPDLLGGLYSNFEKMDSAHIAKTIPVDATIPVKFDLQLNQQTNVVLSESVTINNAYVTVNTGGLNITRAAATVILPQGTNLPVFLNLTVPVDTTIPVKLNVAVDIPLTETQLHDPFVGLRDVVAPLYCLFKPDATDMNGLPICK